MAAGLAFVDEVMAFQFASAGFSFNVIGLMVERSTPLIPDGSRVL